MNLNNISKRYGQNSILDDVSIKFVSNSINLIIGKNGTGKTTLLKIISGLIKKYEGSKEAANCSKIMDMPCFFTDKTGYENLSFLLEENELNNSLQYIDKFGMKDYINNKVKTYSQGMNKKLAIVLALSKNAEVILLDEPTNSLDYESILILKGILRELKSMKTIIISSHDIAIFDKKLIDNVYVIKDKKLIKSEKEQFEYLIYKVRTKEIIDSNLNVIVKKEDYYYIKVKNEDVPDLANKLITYGLLEFCLLNYLDEMYLKEIGI